MIALAAVLPANSRTTFKVYDTLEVLHNLSVLATNKKGSAMRCMERSRADKACLVMESRVWTTVNLHQRCGCSGSPFMRILCYTAGSKGIGRGGNHCKTHAIEDNL